MNSENIKLIRLVTGEEILAEILKSFDTVEIKNPVIIIPTGNNNLGIMPWLNYAEYDTIELKQDHVMFVVAPKQDMLNEYLSIFDDKKIVAPERKIVLN